MSLQKAEVVFRAVLGDRYVPGSVVYESRNQTYTGKTTDGEDTYTHADAIDRLYSLATFQPVPDEVTRLRRVVEEQDKALLHWRKSFDEIDAKETEAWRQVNELTQKNDALKRQIERMKAHIERQDKNFVAAKAKRDEEIKQYAVTNKVLVAQLFDDDSLANERIQRALTAYAKLWDAYQTTRAYIETDEGRDNLKLRAESELWDFLAEQGNGEQWVARQSTSGRGFRLHNSADPMQWVFDGITGTGNTPREAVIDLYKKLSVKESAA